MLFTMQVMGSALSCFAKGLRSLGVVTTVESRYLLLLTTSRTFRNVRISFNPLALELFLNFSTPCI
jgi:hypothetical protein